MLIRWLLRLLRRIAPREGWSLFVVALLTLLMLAFAVVEAEWVDGLSWLLARVLVLGYLAAFALTRIGLKRDPLDTAAKNLPLGGVPGWAAALLLALLGLLAVTLVAGWGVAPQPPQGLRWYWRPLVRAGLALVEVGQRLVHWSAAARAGVGVQDDVVFGWLAGLLAWAAAAWAGWWIYYCRQALIGLLPAGFLLATHLFFAWKGRGWLPVFLGGLVLTAALVRLRTLERKWQARGMDYSQEIQIDMGAAAVVMAAAVIALSALMPRVVITPTARWFYERMAKPVSTVEDAGKRLFPDLNRSPRSLLASGGGPGGLPRSFLLGSGPELSEEVVLRVATSDIDSASYFELDWEPPERQYWRALTYDSYNGRGWRNGPTETLPLEAGEPWYEGEMPRRRPLKQTVEVLRGGDRAFYAAGEPLAPNRPYEAQLRAGLAAPDDLVAMLGDGRRYEVLSLVPAASEAELRAAGRNYPPGLLERYLALPEIPARVVELARQVTAGADTPYDQALALEQFLRGYRYDLDVNAPPPGRDVADYFLFDLKAGYCDYYATAMIVMARSLGIPARIAIGYATGDLDRQEGVYLVAEDSAHSWPEVYFPGVGWVPFEPTAARPVFVRRGLPAEAVAGRPEQVAEQLQVFEEDAIIRRRLRWVIGVPLALLLAAVLTWLWQRRPEPELVELYRRLGRWGRRMGRPPAAGETVREFGHGFGQELRQLGGDRGRLAASGVADFVIHFEGAQYSRRRSEAAQATRRVWIWLAPLLRRLWMLRFVRRRRGES